MDKLPRIAALAMLSAAAVLGAACMGGRATTEEPVTTGVGDLTSGDDEGVGEARSEQGWGALWRYCRPWRRCVYRFGHHACSRWMPQRAYYCGRSYPGGPRGGYPPPGGGYPPEPPGGYPPEPPGGGYPPGPPGGGYPDGPPGNYPGENEPDTRPPSDWPQR